MRSIEEIRETGAAWVTEAELALLCAFAKRAEVSEARVRDLEAALNRAINSARQYAQTDRAERNYAFYMLTLRECEDVLRDTTPAEGFFARGEDGQYHPDPAPAEDRSTAPWDAWKHAEARVRELEEVIVAFADFWYLDATFAGIEAVAKQIRERRPKP